MASNTRIALKRSSSPGNVPPAANLVYGELAINYADGKLYFKNTNDQVVEISPPPTIPNSFGTVNANSTLIIADTSSDVLTLEAGDNIQIVGDAINDKITISAQLTAGDPGPAFNKANTANTTADYAYYVANQAFSTANNGFANVANNVFAGSIGIGNTVFSLGGTYTDLTLGNPTNPGRIIIWDSSSGKTFFDAISGGGYRFQGADSSGTLKNEFFVYPGVGNYFRGYDTGFDLEATKGAAYSSVTGINIDKTGNVIVKVLDNEVFRATNTGNVAIGRTSAGYKLDVAGTINAANILINGNAITVGGGSSVNVGYNPPPAGNTDGNLWWNSNTGRLLIWYTDSGSAQWVDATIPGPIGPTGSIGPAGNVQVGNTTTTAPNTPVSVTNSGNGSYAVLNFNIPRPNTTTIGTTTILSPATPATVTNGGTASDIILNFGIARPNTTALGTTTTLTPATPPTVTNGGNTSDIILNFGIPRSNTVRLGNTSVSLPNVAPNVTNAGNTSDVVLEFSVPRNNSVSLGTTTTLAPNTPPTVTNSGTNFDIILDFGIPRNNTVALGTTSILAPNTPPTVTNGGTASDVVLNFGLPRSNTVSLNPTTVVLAPNTPPTVTNTGTASDVVLQFSIPRNNTTTVGTTTTGAPGSVATVTNGGTASDITLNFTIPRGNVGVYSPKSITVVGPQAGDEYTIFYTGAIAQSLVLANLVSLTSSQNVAWANSSVVANVYYGTDRWYPSATPILTLYNSGNSRVGNSTATFTNSTIPANNYVYMRIHSVANTPAEYHVSLLFSPN